MFKYVHKCIMHNYVMLNLIKNHLIYLLNEKDRQESLFMRKEFLILA